METLDILGYGGIAILALLLVIYEWKDGCIGLRKPPNIGYEYYTADNSRVKICKAFGTLYKIYVFGNCPVETQNDRFGTYFTLRASSASEAEYLVDDIYQHGGVV